MTQSIKCSRLLKHIVPQDRGGRNMISNLAFGILLAMTILLIGVPLITWFFGGVRKTVGRILGLLPKTRLKDWVLLIAFVGFFGFIVAMEPISQTLSDHGIARECMALPHLAILVCIGI